MSILSEHCMVVLKEGHAWLSGTYIVIKDKTLCAGRGSRAAVVVNCQGSHLMMIMMMIIMRYYNYCD